MTEKQLDAAINVPVNCCDMLGLVVPYKSLTMIVTSFPCLKCNKRKGVSLLFPQGPKDPRMGPQITSTPIKCHVMLLNQIFAAF